jgi:hypothetical protein
MNFDVMLTCWVPMFFCEFGPHFLPYGAGFYLEDRYTQIWAARPMSLFLLVVWKIQTNFGNRFLTAFFRCRLGWADVVDDNIYFRNMKAFGWILAWFVLLFLRDNFLGDGKTVTKVNEELRKQAEIELTAPGERSEPRTSEQEAAIRGSAADEVNEGAVDLPALGLKEE